MSLKTRGILVLVIGTMLGVSLSIGGALLGGRDAAPEKDLSWEQARLFAEVMERVKREALSELARVARRWVVMLEPFRDFNQAPEQVYYTKAKEYLSAAVEDLPAYGLRPLQVFDDFPSKVNRGVGLVLAEPVRNLKADQP